MAYITLSAIQVSHFTVHCVKSTLKRFVTLSFYSALKRIVAAMIMTLALLACTPAPPPEVTSQQHTDNGSYAASLSHAGLYAAVSTPNGVLFWDIEKNRTNYVWNHKQNQSSEIHIVDISFDNRVVLSADKHSFSIWNVDTGANKGFYSIQESTIADAKISNQGQYAVIALLNGEILHIDLTTGRRLVFLGHTDRISGLEISPNGHYILSGSYDGTALLWNGLSGQVVHTFEHSGRISQVALDSQARFAFTANSTNESWIWDLKTGQKITELQYPVRQQIFTRVVFSHNGKWLATGAPNQKIKIWQVNNGALVTQWPFKAGTYTATVLDFAFDLQDAFLTAETSLGHMQTWSIKARLNDQ